ncbi:hypothetical protein GCM10027360_33380 [Amycolatopsis echigonensis]
MESPGVAGESRTVAFGLEIADRVHRGRGVEESGAEQEHDRHRVGPEDPELHRPAHDRGHQHDGEAEASQRGEQAQRLARPDAGRERAKGGHQRESGQQDEDDRHSLTPSAS